jgi:hypothetical protein
MYSSGRMARATRSSLTGGPDQSQLAGHKRKLEAGSVRSVSLDDVPGVSSADGIGGVASITPE